MSVLPLIEVAACIVPSADGRVLVAERGPHQLSPGFWELPGGKVDPGETTREAAARELREEVGLEAHELQPWLSYEYRFPARRIRLHVFTALSWSGTPHGREGQRIAWIDPRVREVAPILPSNERVLRGLALPARYVQLRVDARGPGALLDDARAALANGATLLGVDVAAAVPDQRVAFSRRVVSEAHARGAFVLLAGNALEAERAGADGVHSHARDLRRATARPEVPLWFASCDDERDLAHAVACGADAAVIDVTLVEAVAAAPPPLRIFRREGDGA